MTHKHRPVAAICGAIYGIVAIVTFGYAAAQSYRHELSAYSDCQAKKLIKQRAICIDDSSLTASTTGLGAAILWPLYWSWEAQQ